MKSVSVVRQMFVHIGQKFYHIHMMYDFSSFSFVITVFIVKQYPTARTTLCMSKKDGIQKDSKWNLVLGDYCKSVYPDRHEMICLIFFGKEGETHKCGWSESHRENSIVAKYGFALLRINKRVAFIWTDYVFNLFFYLKQLVFITEYGESCHPTNRL